MAPVTIHGVNDAALSEERVGGEDEVWSNKRGNYDQD